MIFGWLTTILTKLLGFLTNRSDAATKRLEIEAKAGTERGRTAAQLQTAIGGQQVAVIQSLMSSKLFWVPWMMATVPVAAWFGWGMLDSLFNGALPDVAALPPQLKEYADGVWANIVYTGGGVKTAQLISGVILARR